MSGARAVMSILALSMCAAIPARLDEEPWMQPELPPLPREPRHGPPALVFRDVPQASAKRARRRARNLRNADPEAGR